MKKFFIIFIISLLSYSLTSANNFIDNIFDGKRIKVFEYDLSSKKYRLKVGVNENYKASSLRDLMEKNNGISAINGVFLCPADYRECWGKDFTKNERYVMGEKFGTEENTEDRVIFAWDKNNSPFLYQTNKINPEKEKDIYYGLANFPLILQDGEDKIHDYQEKGLVDSKMKVNGTRNFVCSNKEKTKIYTGLVFDISLIDLPKYLKDFGCYDALNLDAGKTTSMIYNGRQIVGPGRVLLDGIIIERVGLDTSKIISISKKVMENIKKKIEEKNTEEKIEYLETITRRLGKYKNYLYDNNSSKFYKEDKQTGYKIEMNDYKDLGNMYFINYISRDLSILISELKKEKIEEENTFNLLF